MSISLSSGIENQGFPEDFYLKMEQYQTEKFFTLE